MLKCSSSNGCKPCDKIKLKNTPCLYLDMDETIVDWFFGANLELSKAGYPSWNDVYWNSYSEIDANNLKWSILNSNPNFWESLPFTSHGLDIWNFVKPYKPKILTAYNEYTEDCKIGKIIWIVNNLGVTNISGVHIVRRHQKSLFAKTPSNEPNILIDDYHKNCLEYSLAGGISIQTTTAQEVIEKLKTFGFA